MDTKIDPVPKHVPRIGGLRVQRESVPRFGRSKAEQEPSPKLESLKEPRGSIKVKKDPNAPSFKVPELEVIKEYKPKYSPIKFIDGDKK
jgi:hypothetical protein